tara:strand:- start:39 stop:482 length:444 start_codon:yes stop_codon:yes gene_type:complete
MNLEGIISVSGKSGLHKIVSQGKNSVIVESLSDKKRMPVYSHTAANSLEEIGIYTYEDTEALVDVFTNIANKEKYKECISHKAPKKELEEYFRLTVPKYDEDRVYISDIKKVFQWYNSLLKEGIIALPKKKNETIKKNISKTKKKDE